MKNKLYSKVRADVLKQLYSRFLLISVVAFLGVFSVNAQNLNVKGKVFDKNTREPLIGVTVLEKVLVPATVQSLPSTVTFQYP